MLWLPTLLLRDIRAVSRPRLGTADRNQCLVQICYANVLLLSPGSKQLIGAEQRHTRSLPLSAGNAVITLLRHCSGASQLILRCSQLSLTLAAADRSDCHSDIDSINGDRFSTPAGHSCLDSISPNAATRRGPP